MQVLAQRLLTAGVRVLAEVFTSGKATPPARQQAGELPVPAVHRSAEKPHWGLLGGDRGQEIVITVGRDVYILNPPAVDAHVVQKP